ncbi:MAG: lysylphosphatidylglycerol synthase domain-containing protein, partial [Microthrixaceae bacterium]
MSDATTAQTDPAVTGSERGPGLHQDEMFDPAEAVSGYERSPEDLLRLVVSAAVLVVVLLITKLLSDATGGLQRDFVNLVGVGSAELLRVLEGLLSLTALALGLLTLALPLLTRRLRTFGYVLAASIAVSLLMSGFDGWLGLTGAVNEAAIAAGLERSAIPDANEIASSAASVVVFSPFVTRRWRQALWTLFGVLLVLDVAISVHPPAATIIALAVGPMVGSATLLAFGRPTSRPKISAISRSLASAGLTITSLEAAAVDARGSTPYFAVSATDERLFVKVLGANERAADLLFRLYRRLRLRNVGDERPDSSLRRTVEHEALVSLQARDVGVRSPRMRAVASVGQDSFLLAYDQIDGSSIDKVPEDQLDHRVLTELWEQVAVMRRHRIAHRDLRLANVFLDGDASPWIIDFGFAEVAASDALLNADVAQLLASLATAVGTDRALSGALEVLGTDAVAEAVPRLQNVALSGATQTALKEQPGLLDALREEAMGRVGIVDPELDALTRFRPSNGVVLAISAALLFVGLPIYVGFDDVADVLGSADWSHLATVIGALVALLVATTWQLYSVAPVSLPAWPTFLSAVASFFASTTGPAQAKGNSFNARFLQRHGLPRDEARAAVALGRAAPQGALALMLGAFVIWAAPTSFDAIDIDRPGAIWIGLAVVIVIAVASLAIPSVRSELRGSFGRSWSRTKAGVVQLSASPSRLVTTAAAGTLVAVVHLVALRNSLEIFGVDTPMSTIGVIVFASLLVASFVPTPGHVMAIEVLLLAGLRATGIDLAQALCGVLLYRIAVFWTPVALGAVALRLLK